MLSIWRQMNRPEDRLSFSTFWGVFQGKFDETERIGGCSFDGNGETSANWCSVECEGV